MSGAPPSWTGSTLVLPAAAKPHSTVFGPTASRRRPLARSGRHLLVLLFWLFLAAGLWLWWRDTPAGSVDGAAAAMEEAGRVTGMIGGYALLVQVLMMSRVRWLERHVGATELMAWHRDIGVLVVVTVLAHMVLAVLARSAYDAKSVAAETWSMLSTYEDMVSAFIATGILVAVGLLAIRAIRAIMPYEMWYYLHLATYVVLVLSYGHQFADGRELTGPSLGRMFWTGLYVFVVAAVCWGRLLGPIAFNIRHRLRVADVVDEGGQDMFSVYISGRRLDEIGVRAGQFFRWRFLTFGCWWQAHPFSLSAAPNGRWLRLTIKAVGDHTGQLRGLEPGVRIFAEGPAGIFTAERRTRHRALLIAGGSGIAPIRALLEDLPRGTIVIYRASSMDDLIFRAELDWLADERGAEVYYVIGRRDDPGPRWVMSPKGLRDLVPDIARRDVFLCGPGGLVTAAQGVLKKLRVPRRQVHLDPFEF